MLLIALFAAESIGLAAVSARAGGSVSAADSQPPVTTISITGPVGLNGWYTGAVKLHLNATDDGQVAATYARLDGGNWTTYIEPIAVAADGTHDVQFYSTDDAGNIEAVHTVGLSIDSVPPGTSVTVLGPWNETSLEYTGPATVYLGANDSGSGVEVVRFQADAGLWSNYTRPVILSSTSVHVLNYSAEDMAGNEEPVGTVLIPVGVSYSGPELFPAIPAATGAHGWYNSSVRVGLQAASLPGTASTAFYRIDDGPWVTYAAPFTVADGQHTLYLKAVDARNRTTASQPLIVRVDTVAPMTGRSVTGAAGPDGWYLSNVTVDLVALDATSGVASTWYAADAGAWQQYAGSIPLGRGHHLLLYRSVDVAGNREGTWTAAINVVTVGPRFVASGPSGVVTQSQVTISWSATDPGLGTLQYAVSVDGGGFVSVGPQDHLDLSLPDGQHYVVIRATDATDSSTLAIVTFTTDTNPFSPSGPLSGFPLYLIMTIGIGSVGLVAISRRRRRSSRRPVSGAALASSVRGVRPLPRGTVQVSSRTRAEDRYVPVQPRPFHPPGTKVSAAARRR